MIEGYGLFVGYCFIDGSCLIVVVKIVMIFLVWRLEIYGVCCFFVIDLICVYFRRFYGWIRYWSGIVLGWGVILVGCCEVVEEYVGGIDVDGIVVVFGEWISGGIGNVGCGFVGYWNFFSWFLFGCCYLGMWKNLFGVWNFLFLVSFWCWRLGGVGCCCVVGKWYVCCLSVVCKFRWNFWWLSGFGLGSCVGLGVCCWDWVICSWIVFVCCLFGCWVFCLDG